MSGFSSDWLALREPFDTAARATAAAVAAFATTRSPGAPPWQVTDLACGTGANLRALVPRLGHAQQWCAIDHDPALLAAMPAALEAWAARHGHHLQVDGDRALNGPIRLEGDGFSARVLRQRLDLATALHALPLPRGGLLTASALLDLVSAAWLQGLISKARNAAAPMLFTLTVDGRGAWSPPDAEDARVQALFMLHQRRDKGFGPALGPRAAAQALQLLADAGWTTRQACADWLIDGAEAPQMLQAMIDGSAAAAAEQDAAAAPRLRAWAARRHTVVAGTRLLVGHLDIAAVPPAPA